MTEWHQNISIRTHLIFRVLDKRRPFEEGWSRRDKKHLENALKALRETPLVMGVPDATYDDALLITPDPRDTAQSGHNVLVSPMSVYDAYYSLRLSDPAKQRKLARLMATDSTEYLETAGGKAKKSTILRPSPAYLKALGACGKFWHEPLYRERNLATIKRHTIVLDLTAPDQLVLEAVRTYLESARKEFGATNGTVRNRMLDVSKWDRYGLLPYLDLMIFAREESVEITRTVIARALFANNENYDVQTLDKVTRPLAEELLSADYALFRKPEALGSQIDKMTSLFAMAVAEERAKSKN